MQEEAALKSHSGKHCFSLVLASLNIHTVCFVLSYQHQRSFETFVLLNICTCFGCCSVKVSVLLKLSCCWTFAHVLGAVLSKSAFFWNFRAAEYLHMFWAVLSTSAFFWNLCAAEHVICTCFVLFCQTSFFWTFCAAKYYTHILCAVLLKTQSQCSFEPFVLLNIIRTFYVLFYQRLKVGVLLNLLCCWILYAHFMCCSIKDSKSVFFWTFCAAKHLHVLLCPINISILFTLSVCSDFVPFAWLRCT